MGTRLVRRYSFAAAHKLACGAAHQCARLHGHTYDVAITVQRVTHDVCITEGIMNNDGGRIPRAALSATAKGKGEKP